MNAVPCFPVARSQSAAHSTGGSVAPAAHVDTFGATQAAGGVATIQAVSNVALAGSQTTWAVMFIQWSMNIGQKVSVPPDDRGNIWKCVDKDYSFFNAELNPSNEATAMYVAHIKGNGVTTVTVNWDANVGDCQIMICVMSGIKFIRPLDRWSNFDPTAVYIPLPGIGVDAASLGAFTPNYDNCPFVVFGGNVQDLVQCFTAGTDYTMRLTQGGGGVSLAGACETFIQGAAAAKAMAFTLSADRNIVMAGCIMVPNSASIALTSYTTSFPGTENPISEGGATWTQQGLAQGIDWRNIKTNGGTASCDVGSTGFDDSTALVSGAAFLWRMAHSAEVTIFGVNAIPNGSESEVRVASHVRRKWSRGYEGYNFNGTAAPGPYLKITKWNGLLNDFTNILNVALPPSPANGDRMKVTLTISDGTDGHTQDDNVLKIYWNDVLRGETVDNDWYGGWPGVGGTCDLGGGGAAADAGETDATFTDL